jgi:hypothetical protein
VPSERIRSTTTTTGTTTTVRRPPGDRRGCRWWSSPWRRWSSRVSSRWPHFALPLVGADLGVSTAATAWVLLAYSLPMAALAIPAGRWPVTCSSAPPPRPRSSGDAAGRRSVRRSRLADGRVRCGDGDVQLAHAHGESRRHATRRSWHRRRAHRTGSNARLGGRTGDTDAEDALLERYRTRSSPTPTVSTPTCLNSEVSRQRATADQQRPTLCRVRFRRDVPSGAGMPWP